MRHAAALITALSLLAAGATLHAEDGAKPALTQNGPEVQPTGELKVGDRIQPFTLPLLGGGEVSWPKDLKDQVLVVNFWATWCAPCVEEIPALERLRRQLKGSDVTVLTINIDEDGQMAEVRQLLEKSRAQSLTALDPGGQFALSWGTAKLPETYVIDPDGVVKQKIIGAQVWDRGDRVQDFKALASRHP